MVNYFYKGAYSNMQSQYGDFMSYLLDTNTPLDEQTYDEESGQTWADFFTEQGLTTAAEVYAIADEAKANGYTLSEDFIHMIRMTGTWKDYDEQVLKELGYAFVSDPSYSQGYFIEPLDQTERSYQYYLENDIRYSYSYADFKDGDKVTAIGIQDGQTLKKAPGMTEYLMKGEMDMETAIKEGGAAGIGLKIFSIAISLIFMLGGVLMFVIKR